MNALEIVQGYHAATKHHANRYARSPGYLDWATQPDPFRRYAGAPRVLFPFRDTDESAPYEEIYEPGRVTARPISIHTVAAFLECSLAISAWKQYGDSRWALRCNPSSGNLHPTEGYLIAPALAGLNDSPGVYHYAPREHALELRCGFSEPAWNSLRAGFPGGTFFAGLSSIHWREAWKYGERAYRYCQHDVGHALAALVVAAAALGWSVRHLNGLSDTDVTALLGLDRVADFDKAERECPDLIAAIIPSSASAQIPGTLTEPAIRGIAQGGWRGQANALSSDHVQWEIIDRVAAACAKPRTAATAGPPAPVAAAATIPRREPCGATVKRIVQQRRSAVDMDGATSISRETFYGMLLRTMPFPGSVPWSAVGWPAAIHLGLFVHRVTGIAPGIYCLVRNRAHESELRSAMNPRFLWETPDACPEALPLFRLLTADCRDAAVQVSCGQDIAGDGAFSLGMLARFENSLLENGPWFYRNLFWEAGMIGQVLYLEAEAAGVRGTGIGCFFDDSVHQIFGLRDGRYQSLYHFTVGGPVDDPRLTTLPAYGADRKQLEGPAKPD